MAHIAQGEVNNYNNGYCIDLWTHVNNVLTDVAELSFKIFDITSNSKRTEYHTANKNNVQVYPAAGQRQSVNVGALVTDPIPGHKISTGHYYAEWTCPTGEPEGDHIIEWFFKRTPTSNERAFREEFVVTTTPISPGGGSGCIVTHEMVRRYMKDYYNENILLDALDYKDAEIDQATCMIVDKYNIMPVWTTYTCENFPSKYLLLIGIAAHLLSSTSISQLRNQLGYNDGNIHVDLTDKHQLYLAASRTLWQEWDLLARQTKNYINLNGDGGAGGAGSGGAWGDLGSPYSTE